MATWQRIYRIRVLAKMAFFGNVPDSPDSPTFANLFCWDSRTFAKSHFWKKYDSPRYIRTSNERVTRIWGEWPLLSLEEYFIWVLGFTYVFSQIRQVILLIRSIKILDEFLKSTWVFIPSLTKNYISFIKVS